MTVKTVFSATERANVKTDGMRSNNIDATGKQQFVCSWKLEKTDKTPQGKRDDISLREKEKLILKDIADAIVPCGGEMTVLELVKKYLLQKTGVRHNTEANYNFVVNIIKKEDFGKKRIDKVKLSDLLFKWLSMMILYARIRLSFSLPQLS